MEDEARKVMARIPVLAGYGGPLERMGGLTNASSARATPSCACPGKGTEEYIDRAQRGAAARAAAAAGVSPEVLYVDPPCGIMVTRFIDGTVTMTPEAFRTRPGAPARAGAGVPPASRVGRRLSRRASSFSR